MNLNKDIVKQATQQLNELGVRCYTKEVCVKYDTRLDAGDRGVTANAALIPDDYIDTYDYIMWNELKMLKGVKESPDGSVTLDLQCSLYRNRECANRRFFEVKINSDLSVNVKEVCNEPFEM